MTALALAALLAASPPDAPFGRDKGLHLIVGWSIGAGSHAIASAYLPKANPFAVGLGTVTVVASGKELADLLTGKGTPSWLDWGWGILGGALGVVTSWAVQQAFR